jgi:hypothetical protein
MLFACQVLYRKIKADWHMLDTSQRKELKQYVESLLGQRSDESQPKQLCPLLRDPALLPRQSHGTAYVQDLAFNLLLGLEKLPITTFYHVASLICILRAYQTEFQQGAGAALASEAYAGLKENQKA